MWAIPTGANWLLKKKNQVESPSIWSRVPETSSDPPIGSDRDSGRDNLGYRSTIETGSYVQKLYMPRHFHRGFLKYHLMRSIFFRGFYGNSTVVHIFLYGWVLPFYLY